MLVSNVIVMFRNNEAIIPRFFECLYRKDRNREDDTPPIVMLDQASEDETFGLLNDHRRACDIVKRFEENKSLSVARNIGVESMDAQFHILLDSDVFMSTSVLELLEPMEDDPDCGMTVGFVVTPNGEPGWGICLSAFRRSAYDAVGGFHEGYQMFYDDTEFLDSVVRVGFHCPQTFKAIGLHMVGETISRGSEKHRRDDCLTHDEKLYRKRKPIIDSGAGLNMRGIVGNGIKPTN